jgi:hypothetical protein
MKRMMMKLVGLGLLALSAPLAQAQGVDPITAWCNSTIEVLGQAEAAAAEARIFGGSDAEVQALNAGLTQAAEQGAWPGAQGPLTYRALQRGIQISSELQQAMGTVNGGTRTIAYFLHGYYEFVRRVVREFDVYFIPRTYCRGCGYSVPDYAYEIERHTVDFAAAELKVAADRLATNSGDRPYPVGPADAPSIAFLTVLKDMTGYVVEDLRPSLMASPFACMIMSLEQMQADATQSLTPGNSEYQRAYDFQRLYGEAQYFAGQLSQPRQCAGWPNAGPNGPWGPGGGPNGPWRQ